MSDAIRIVIETLNLTLAKALACGSDRFVRSALLATLPLLLLPGTFVQDALAQSATTPTATIRNSHDRHQIHDTGGPVTEGEYATFWVNLNKHPCSLRTVNLEITNAPGSDFLPQSKVPTSVLILGGCVVKDDGEVKNELENSEIWSAVRVPTDDDETGEADGSVRVRILPGNGYKVGSPSSASRQVLDNDGDPPANAAPTVANAIPDQSATAGTAFSHQFPENAFSDADGDSLTYTATQGDGSELPSWLVFNAGTRTFSGTPSAGDAGTVTVRVTADDGKGGTVSDDFVITVSASVTPVVSVSGGSAVTEGGNAEFTLTASPAPTGSITVNVKVTQVGTFAASGQAGTKTVTIGTGGTGSFTVTTDDDGIDEPHGAIIATVRDGSGYSTNGEDGSASVTVNDNDDPVPVASFASGSSSQDEDQGTRVVDIRVDLDPAPQSAITLGYDVGGTATQGPDFTIANSGTVNADPGDDHVNIPVRIIDDSTPDGGETVVLTLAEGTGYSVGAPSSHTVTITNDNDTGGGGGGPQQTAPPEETGDSATDLPTVTVMPGPSPVDEGTAAGFTVRRSGSTASALTVLLTVSEDGTEGQDFVAPEDEGDREVVIPAGSDKVVHEVPTADDDVPEPDGRVTVALRGSDDEYTVGNPTRASVTVRDDDGLPEASFAMAATRASEGDGAVDVTILLDPAPTVPVTLRYAVSGTASPGTGTDGDFDIAGSGSVVVPAGAVRATVRIALRDDREDEDDETVILALAEGEGYVLADGGITRHVLTMADDDGTSAAAADVAARTAFLTRLGRTVGLQAVDAITDRLAADRAPGFAGTLSGGWLPKHREPAMKNGIAEARRFLAGPDPEDVGTGEIVAGTAFALTRDAADDLSVAVWGRGARSAFGGTEGGSSLDGEVTGFMFGTDWTRGDRLFGVMLSRSRGEVRYGLGSGRIETSLTSVVPYAARDVDGRIRAWGAAGLGGGDVVLVPNGGSPVSADVRWRMAAAGVSGALDGAGLGWTADALWTRTASDAAAGLLAASGETLRVRAGLDGRWVRTLASGATVSPRLEAGLRHDGGDAETGLGLEIGGGVDWSDPELGLSLGLEGRTLALHEDGDFEDRSLAFTLSYDPRPGTKRGFSLAMKQDLGSVSSGGVGALPTPEAFPDAGNVVGKSDWTAEAAIGTGRGRGMVGSRYAALGGGRPGRVDDVRLGYRVEPDADHAPDASVSVWGGAEDAEAAAGAALEWRW